MNSKQLDKWEKTRKRGKWDYAILSALISGLGFVVIHYLVTFILNTLNSYKDAETPSLVFYVSMFIFGVIVYIPINLIVWNKNESEYLSTLDME